MEGGGNRRESDSDTDEGGYMTPGEVADDERAATPTKEDLSVDGEGMTTPIST